MASGGGQQGPILAAAGATVTVFDNSPAQLAQDRLVADRDNLRLTTVAGVQPHYGFFGRWPVGGGISAYRFLRRPFSAGRR